MSKLHQFFTELPAHKHIHIFISGLELISTDFHLDMCIDIVEIWFGIAIVYISSVFDSYLPMTRWLHVFIFH